MHQVTELDLLASILVLMQSEADSSSEGHSSLAGMPTYCINEGLLQTFKFGPNGGMDSVFVLDKSHPLNVSPDAAAIREVSGHSTAGKVARNGPFKQEVIVNQLLFVGLS